MGPTALLPLRRKACWGIFSPWKTRRLRPGLNPRTWVPKASALPLDHRSRLNYPLFLTYFNKTWIFSIFFENSQISNFMKIRPMGAELFHTDGQTDVTKLPLCNFVNQSKKSAFVSLNYNTHTHTHTHTHTVSLSLSLSLCSLQITPSFIDSPSSVLKSIKFHDPLPPRLFLPAALWLWCRLRN